MAPDRIAYIPLTTYPDVVPDEPVAAAVALGVALGCRIHATTFGVDIRHVPSPLGGALIDIKGMVRATEDASRAHCQRLQQLVADTAGARVKVTCAQRDAIAGTAGDVAAGEARYFDVALLPWAVEQPMVQDLAQTVVFGAGRPCILVPPSAGSDAVGHVAVAWDSSRVAARALADAMPLLAADGRVTVLTVDDEKPLDGSSLAEALASSLESRGIRAEARHVTLGGRTIARALQESALEVGAGLLAMGGFGHSRLRDIVLGGATKGVFADLRLPVLLSH